MSLAEELDVAIIGGGGIAGLLLIKKLRDAGMHSVHAFEAQDSVGGTWLANRYPGARCDVRSFEYQYYFDESLLRDWTWSSLYPDQPEIVRYLNVFAERFDLLRNIAFSSRVAAATWDAASSCWRITVAGGAGPRTVMAKYVIAACGCLSIPKDVDIKGLSSFAGTTLHTARWPLAGYDFTGQRTGVIGTGSSAVQSVPIIAAQAAHLTVFQRTPAYVLPAQQRALTEAETAAEAKLAALEGRASALANQFGFVMPPGFTPKKFEEAGPEEVQATFEAFWAAGGFALGLAFSDIITNQVANDAAADFVRAKIRAVVKDPATADALCAHGYPLGAKRICIDDNNYYGTFNCENVSLVNVREDPIAEVTPDGIKLMSGREVPLDTLVLATGFDAMTGALARVDVRGVDGCKLADKWSQSPTAYLGLAVAGFPNMFLVTGPQSPSVLANMHAAIEQHVNWIVDTIQHNEASGVRSIEATPAAEEAWAGLTDFIYKMTVFSHAGANSWYKGANVPGKPERFMVYLGGVGAYGAKLQEVKEKGYEGEGFVLQRAAAV